MRIAYSTVNIMDPKYSAIKVISYDKCIISGGVPASRWVVNFDFDLLDGLVIAAVIGAHAPFVVC